MLFASEDGLRDRFVEIVRGAPAELTGAIEREPMSDRALTILAQRMALTGDFKSNEWLVVTDAGVARMSTFVIWMHLANETLGADTQVFRPGMRKFAPLGLVTELSCAIPRVAENDAATAPQVAPGLRERPTWRSAGSKKPREE